MRNSRLSTHANSAFADDDVNPMETVANIVDVMLVFACGLLLALVTVWNVDIGLDRSNMYEVNDVVEEVEEVPEDGLVEAGTVYRDPETGNFYFLEESDVK